MAQFNSVRWLSSGGVLIQQVVMHDGAKGRPECDGQENEEGLAFKMLIEGMAEAAHERLPVLEALLDHVTMSVCRMYLVRRPLRRSDHHMFKLY